MNKRPIFESLTLALAYGRKTLRNRSGWRTAWATLVLWAATVIVSPAQIFTTLASFNDSDGAYSDAPLIQGSDGNFYGTTLKGGANFSGAVFKMTPQGVLSTLYSFCAQTDCADGEFPSAGLVEGSDGNFYGTTTGDPSNNTFGTVFKITVQHTCSNPGPTGPALDIPCIPITEYSFSTLHSFCSLKNCADGTAPTAGLVEGSDGNFYGTTFGNETDSFGTVFVISPQGGMQILYGFCALTNCADGADPNAGLMLDNDGNFYGTTTGGGANGYGTAFKISPQGVLTTLHSFCSLKNCVDGAYPYAGLVLANDGNFYGTTLNGGTNNGGTVFKMTPQGVLTTLYSFCSQTGCTDGANPDAGLVQGRDGNFYGTTSSYGPTNQGTIFRITSAGALATLYSFCSQTGCTDGAGPEAGLVQGSDGKLYGTTNAGGENGEGVVFSLGLLNFPALGEQVDYFRESTADFTVWRPSNGTWYTIDGTGKALTKPWGLSTDQPVIGDYDGDGKTDIAVWRPSNGTWFVILSSTGQVVEKPWGEKGDIPVPGDYDGDGKTDFAVWRPSNGTWFVIESSTSEVVEKPWGEKGDIPVPGDYDGDGKTDFAVWRPSNGTWFVILSSTGQVVEKQWGLSTDIPVPGDYDGDGKTDFAVWRPSNGTWFVIQSSTGKVVEKAWGSKGDAPVPRDYDGDGKTDFAVWRPSNGTWYVIETSNGKTIARPWGVSTDIAINKPVGR